MAFGLPRDARLTPSGGDGLEYAGGREQKSDAHEHAQEVHVRRKRRRVEQQRYHGDECGHRTDEEDDGTGTDQSVTGHGGIRLGFVTHSTRVVPCAQEQSGDVLSPA